MFGSLTPTLTQVWRKKPTQQFAATFSKSVSSVRRERKTIRIEKVMDCWLTDRQGSRQKGTFPVLFLSRLLSLQACFENPIQQLLAKRLSSCQLLLPTFQKQYQPISITVSNSPPPPPPNCTVQINQQTMSYEQLKFWVFEQRMWRREGDKCNKTCCCFEKEGGGGGWHCWTELRP